MSTFADFIKKIILLGIPVFIIFLLFFTQANPTYGVVNFTTRPATVTNDVTTIDITVTGLEPNKCYFLSNFSGFNGSHVSQEDSQIDNLCDGGKILKSDSSGKLIILSICNNMEGVRTNCEDPFDTGKVYSFKIHAQPPGSTSFDDPINWNTVGGELSFTAVTGTGMNIGIGTEPGSSEGILATLTDPLGGRFTSLGQISSSLAPFLLIIGGMVAFLFLILGGFRYMTAQGDPKALSAARGTLTSAIIGLALLASVFVIMTIIEIVFKISILVSLASPAYAQVDIGEQFLFGGEGIRSVFPDLGTFLGRVVRVAIGLAGVVFFAMLVWGGIRYTTARGDEKAVSDARGTLTSAIIGLLIVIASFAIITLISIATGADISIF